MKEHFPNRSILLIPDMAFMLGHKQRSHQPTVDILFLLRTDEERIQMPKNFSLIPAGVTYEVIDWIGNDVCHLTCLLVRIDSCMYRQWCWIMRGHYVNGQSCVRMTRLTCCVQERCLSLIDFTLTSFRFCSVSFRDIQIRFSRVSRYFRLF